MNLLDKQFQRRSKEKAEELLNKAENQIAALSQYTELLTQKKYEKAKEHLEEVEKLEEDIEKVWELFNKNAHKRSAAPPASPAAARRPPPVTDGQIKLVTAALEGKINQYILMRTLLSPQYRYRKIARH